MTDKIIRYMEQYNMTDGCDNIVVGLSGGADSVCLVSVLAKLLSGKLGLRWQIRRVVAVHVNHGIRGEEALRDEKYAGDIAEKLGVEFRLFRLDIPAEAAKKGISEETAGRIARYECFRGVAEELGRERTKIAVAHHMDDQAETVLMHMIRGSSLQGLAGMRPVADDIIRPLLCVTRSEIEQYLSDENLSYVVDSTNTDNSYTRNMVRNCLIPDINKINSRFNNAVCAMAADVSEYVDYVDKMTGAAEEKYVHYVYSSDRCGNAVKAVIDANAVHDGADRLIATNLIKRAYKAVHGDIINLYRVHIEDVYGLFFAECHKCVSLPANVTARRTADGVEIISEEYKISQEEKHNRDIELKLAPDNISDSGSLSLPCGVYGGISKIEWEIIDNISDIKYLNNDYTKYFDYDMIKCEPILRFRRAGDSCIIDAAGHRKKLKQDLIDRKVAKELRDSILLLTVGSDVLWAVGVRRYQQYHVTDSTKRVLKVSARQDDLLR